MINYFLNGEPQQSDQTITVDQMLKQFDYQINSIAVAVNETFIPRASYQQQVIRQDDRIEVLSAMQGG